MLDHCDKCGTDFAFGLPACPHCQTPNARLAREQADAETDADVEVEEFPTSRQKPPTAEKTELPNDAPKIDSK